MTRKIVRIEAKAGSRGREASPSPEHWIRGATVAAGKPAKRLTIDVDKELHRRLRILAATEGRTMAEVVRALLDDACPRIVGGCLNCGEP